MQKSIIFFHFLLLGILVLINSSCKKEIILESCVDDQEQIDTIIRIPENCNSLNEPEISFKYKDSTYVIYNPEMYVRLDSIIVSLPLSTDSIFIPRKTIGITVPLEDSKNFSLVIYNFDNPFDCIPEGKIYEFNEARLNDETYCIYPIPGSNKKYCNYMRALLCTQGNGFVDCTYAQRGYFDITHCEDNLLFGEFENSSFFTEGRLCNIDIN